MGSIRAVFLLVVFAFSIEAQDEPVQVLKDNMKPYYSEDGKIDIVSTLAPKILGEEVVEKLIDANLKIVTTEGVSIQVKGLFLDNKVQTKHVERLLKADSQSVHPAQVKLNIQHHADALQKNFNLILLSLKNASTSYDQKLQPLFDRIQDIDGFYRNLIEHLNVYTDKDLAEQIDEVIMGFKYIQPYQKVVNLISSDITPELIHALITKILKTDYCGGKVTKSQAVILFFDFLIVKVAEGEIFLRRCYEIKEMLTGVDLTKMKLQISSSMEANIRTLYTAMMSHIDYFVVPDVPRDVVNPVKDCFIDLVGTFSGATCTFNSLIIVDEWAPIIISTKDNPKQNTEITTLTFATSCTLSYIPNEVFTIFPNINIFQGSGTKLERLHSDFFINATNVVTLYLYSNKISKVEARTFIHMPKMNQIQLYSNTIKEIDYDAFQGLPIMTILYLHANQIRSLSSDVFVPLTKITNLYLSSNACINKDFTNLNGVLTTVVTEIEINTKCGEKNAAIRSARDQQKFQKELKDNMIGKIEKLERSAQATIGGLQKKVERMESKFEKKFETMEKQIDALVILTEKIASKLFAVTPRP